MFSFGMANLRRLKDVPALEIKPITILVGRNSSGKSSYLRALPLLRQSALTRTSSPILWYGDFVDFGSYEGAISDNDTNKKMVFRFTVDKIVREFKRYFTTTSWSSYKFGSAQSIADCDIVLKATKESAQICSIKIYSHEFKKLYEIHVEHGNNVSSITMDGEDILKYFEGTRFVLPQGSIFPSMFAINDKLGTNTSAISAEVSAASAYLADKLKAMLDKRLKEDAVVELCANLLIEPQITKEFLLQYAAKASTKSWGKLLSEVATKDSKKLFQVISSLHSALQVAPLMRGISDRLRDIISGVLYIGPARARSERYYRYQDLAVSEIDPDGKNFPMFLNSLRDAQFKNLSSWVEELFGYKLDLSKSSGHISINVIEGNSVTNVVDTGYGVSQILPVLGQIWWAMNKPRNPGSRQGTISNDRILVIEQPELHLHPAHQAFLADALVDGNSRFKTSNRNPAKINFVIETHSETLVNRLGQLISENKIKADDVQIVLFEPSEESDRQTDIRISKFGDEGQLIDWPYGFFQPSV